jgi:hypothetical protein
LCFFVSLCVYLNVSERVCLCLIVYIVFVRE